jgi:phenylalanyl-tRNA synthetase beta chain
MKVSLNWLKSLIPLSIAPEEIERLLTGSGLEIEHFEYVDSIKGGLRGLIIGEVLTCTQHPNADKLKLTTVNIGQGEPLSIVCGAPNVKAGIKVIVAPVGTTVHPLQGEPFTINKAKIRGEQSEGMLCAEDEIGLGQSHEGLLILPDNAIIGTPITEIFPVQSDVVFEIGLTANRGDAASHWGVARELATLLKLNITLPSTQPIAQLSDEPVTIFNHDEDACRRYSGIVLNNIKVQDSPDWLKQRLSSIGLKPINNVVDVTNYVLHELGQPLHAFDLRAVANSIHIKRNQKEKFTTLDGVERQLNGQELMIYNATEAMCMAGVYGGIHSGVQSDTQSIFLESAYFSADVIRKAAKQHGISTDSSFRFERGTDPNMCIKALERAVELLATCANAQIGSKLYDLYPKPINNQAIELRAERIESVLGIVIPEQAIEQILNGLGIVITSKANGIYQLEVPPFKSDVTREIDVIEELIRIYGFDNVPLQHNMQIALNYNNKSRLRQTEQSISQILMANGFREIMSNSLSAKAYYNEPNLIELSNPLSSEMDVMRGNMLMGALSSIAYNKNRKQSNTRFFEFGRVYKSHPKGFIEQDQLIIIASGNQYNESWEIANKAVDHYYILSVANKLKAAFKNQNLNIESKQVEADTLKQFGIKDQVFYTVIDWTKLAQNYSFKLKDIPQFPMVRRDLSLVLDQATNFNAIERIILGLKSQHIAAWNVFDVYQGKPLEANQKAISIAFELFDANKTMTDADIDPIMQALITQFESQLKAIIRK